MEEQIHTLSNCEIMRLDVDDEHFYYGGASGAEKEYYLSLTRVLDIGAPFPEGLRQWLSTATMEEQQERLAFTGGRGSKLHAALEALMAHEELDLKSNYPTTYEKDAVTVFIQMMKFLAPSNFHTEQVVGWPKLRVAGTLDFEGWVEEWKLTTLLGKPNDKGFYLEYDHDGDLQLKERWLELAENKRRIHIVIDWKFTGRNAYSHKIQVGTYKTMWNMGHTGGNVSRAFTWRYSAKHKFGFDFQESFKTSRDFKRIYDTTIDYLGEFPAPPQIKRYPDRVRLYDKLSTDRR